MSHQKSGFFVNLGVHESIQKKIGNFEELSSFKEYFRYLNDIHVETVNKFGLKNEFFLGGDTSTILSDMRVT
jgi:hypothetical protein